MRKITLPLMMLLLAVGSIGSYADVTIGHLNYSLNGNTATVTGLADNSVTQLVLPSAVKNDGMTYAVTGIADEAFARCTQLTAVSIPRSVTSIGHDAFAHCINLQSVKLPDSMADIDIGAFFDTNLNSVDIPASVTGIGEGAFSCPGIRSVKCFSQDPAPISAYAFSLAGRPDMAHIYDHAILYVPKGCKRKYMATEGWREFRNMSEISGSDVNFDGETNTADAISVYSYIIDNSGNIDGSEGVVYEDVNCDKEVNTADVVAIYNYIVGGEKSVLDLFDDEQCSDSLRIFKWAINADDGYYTEPYRAPLGGFYSMFLSDTGNNFSLFIPSDNALKRYYDPVSMLSGQPYMLAFEYDSHNEASPISACAYKYDPLTHQTDDEPMEVTIPPAQLYNRLKDMLEAHIIVHDEGEENGIFSDKSFYNTKGGAPVKVTEVAADTIGTKVQGVWQMEHNESCTIRAAFDGTRQTNGYGNGMTYIIDRPLQSNVSSIYSVLNGNRNLRKFFELCQVDPTAVEDAGFLDEYPTREEKDAALNDYMVFTSTGPSTDYNVSFLTDHHYTLFVPTNEAMEQAFAKGLPEWDDVRRFIDDAKQEIQTRQENDPDYDPTGDTETYKIKAQVMCALLLNFVRNHFQRGAVYVDESDMAATQYETECFDAEAGSYGTLTVRRDGLKLKITDAIGHICHTTGNNNIMTRDMQFDRQGDSAATIETSSFAVMHGIDHVLDFAPLFNGRYDTYFRDDYQGDNLDGARAYLRKYPAKPTPRRAAR